MDGDDESQNRQKEVAQVYFRKQERQCCAGSIHIYERNCPAWPSLFCLGHGLDTQTSFAARSCESRLRPL